MLYLEKIFQKQESQHISISRRGFLCALAAIPFSAQIKIGFARTSALTYKFVEPDKDLGLILLADSLHASFPKLYSELKAALSMHINMFGQLKGMLTLTADKVATEFANNEYIVIDGCMFSKSELLLSIFVLESKRRCGFSTRHTDIQIA